MRSLLPLVVGLALAGCRLSTADNDADGYDSEVDCNDSDAAIHPGADELCNNLDDDCDNLVDEDPKDGTAFYADADGDGYGDAATEVMACSAPTGFVPDATDCDDGERGVNPGAVEVCDPDDVDEDCSGLADDADANAIGKTLFYADGDADGFGSGDGEQACDPTAGHPSPFGDDCDDSNNAINPDATEVCDDANVDEDCDGLADNADPSATGRTMYYADVDQDGYGTGTGAQACDPSGTFPATNDTDCDDTLRHVNPGAPELCDDADVDEDCDGLSDDADDSATGQVAWYGDGDSDGYGAGTPAMACDATTATPLRDGSDCDDGDAAINPAATEVCDDADVDEDCDGLADDADSSATGQTTFFADGDADGFGAGSGAALCDASSAYPVADATDCDDADGAINPDATEVCDDADVDEDCDGLSDDADSSATGQTTWYADADADGFGAGSGAAQCDPSSSYPVADPTDCDDVDGDVNPDATEVCDDSGVDEDCNGFADDADSGVTGTWTWYGDGDGDGFGAGTGVEACEATSTHTVLDDSDCDDGDDAINPDATEVCDDADVDEDCDGLSDDADSSAIGQSSFYADDDGDGFGAGSGAALCDASTAFPVTDATDCDDANSSINPDGTEVCDDADADEDCDGLSDDADPSATGQTNWYADNDVDSFGAGSPLAACDATASYPTDDDTDCDDDDDLIYPGADETAGDAIDQDCDGSDLEQIEYAELADPCSIELLYGESFDTTGYVVLTDITDTTGAGVGILGQLGYGVDDDPTSDWSWSDGAWDADVDVFDTADADAWIATLQPDLGGDFYFGWRFSRDEGRSWVYGDQGALCYFNSDEAFGEGSFDGWNHGGIGYVDADLDGDGFDDVAVGGDDCDDTDKAVNPDAGEVYGNGVDDDCDGTADEAIAAASIAAGDLVVSEILFDPSVVTDANGEWFELANIQQDPIELNGLVVESASGSSTESFTVSSSSLYIDGYARVVFGVKADTALNGGAPVAYSWSTCGSSGTSSCIALGNSATGDRITLVSSAGTTIDSVTWTNSASTGTWPYGGSGVSFELDENALDDLSNDDGANWCTAVDSFGDGDLGTPGEANTGCNAS